VRAAVLVVASVLLAKQAGAAPARIPPYEPPHVEREWYGYINLTCDAEAVSTFALAVSATRGDRRENLAYLSLGTFLLGGPIAHWAHGKVGTGFGSLAMRGGMPIMSGFLGCFVTGGNNESDCTAGFFLGTVVGIIAASAIDASALAYTDKTPPAWLARRITPIASPTRNGATIGVVATF
jgi:hypothetical protein